MSDRIESAAKALCVSDYEIHLGRTVEDPDQLWDSYLQEDRENAIRSAKAALSGTDEQLEKFISDLDEARATGIVYTYGLIQRRLREILDQ